MVRLSQKTYEALSRPYKGKTFMGEARAIGAQKATHLCRCRHTTPAEAVECAEKYIAHMGYKGVK